MKAINKRINQWLEFYNITQTAFAKQIGVTKGTVNQWCLGYTSPTPTHEKTMAITYPELNIYWLWGKDESMTRQNILRPVEKAHVDGILKENKYLKEQCETQKMLIEALRAQIKSNPS